MASIESIPNVDRPVGLIVILEKMEKVPSAINGISLYFGYPPCHVLSRLPLHISYAMSRKTTFCHVPPSVIKTKDSIQKPLRY